jgi:hypothetical protein
MNSKVCEVTKLEVVGSPHFSSPVSPNTNKKVSQDSTTSRYGHARIDGTNLLMSTNMPAAKFVST